MISISGLKERQDLAFNILKAFDAYCRKNELRYMVCGGTLIGAMPNTSYGESVGTTGFSKICSKYVIALAAVIMGVAAFIGPLQAFLVSIPSAIFGGCAAVLYGYITLSGIRTIKDNNIDLNNNKNVTIIASVLTLGVSGAVCNFGVVSIGTTALAMIVGIILNLVLKEKKDD